MPAARTTSATGARSTVLRRLPTPLLLAFVVVLCLAPFANKAVHIDDYLFIRSAQQILEHPLDPFGTVVNWYDTDLPLAEVTQNPPGAAYYLAAVGGLFGWSEIALHLAFLLPTIAAVLGTYHLARRLCSQPAMAAIITLLTPVFWLSASTLMCDVPMLALWVWSIELWLRGIERGGTLWFVASATLIALAALSKYFGVALLPLVLAYTLVRERRPSWKLLWLLLPVAALLTYEWASMLRYGHGMLAAAGQYTQIVGRPGTAGQRGLITLAFAGGCLLPVLTLAPRLWTWRWLAAAALGAAGIIAMLARMDTLGISDLRNDGTTQWGLIVQVAIFTMGGLSLLALTLGDLWRNRDADSWMLAFWVGGTLFFTGVLNWSVNGRSLLPLAPAIAILIVRRMTRDTPAPTARSLWLRWWPLLPAAAIAAAVVQTDTAFAGNSRTAARVLHEQLGPRQGAIWFQGHWGFQYYMEAAGAKPLDKKTMHLAPGDYLISPEINTNISAVPETLFEACGDIEIDSSGWIVVMHIPTGAGFYSDQWGPLPFVFAPPPPQRFTVSKARTPTWHW